MEESSEVLDVPFYVKNPASLLSTSFFGHFAEKHSGVQPHELIPNKYPCFWSCFSDLYDCEIVLERSEEEKPKEELVIVSDTAEQKPVTKKEGKRFRIYPEALTPTDLEKGFSILTCVDLDDFAEEIEEMNNVNTANVRFSNSVEGFFYNLRVQPPWRPKQRANFGSSTR